jgi:ABC-type uncharacterized transport system substrate-binding protein
MAFMAGLRERGYIEGQNIIIEYRFSKGRQDQLYEIAAELVRLKVDVIVAETDAATHAAKQATTATLSSLCTAIPCGVASCPTLQNRQEPHRSTLLFFSAGWEAAGGA